jgi:hypothetical protein
MVFMGLPAARRSRKGLSTHQNKKINRDTWILDDGAWFDKQASSRIVPAGEKTGNQQQGFPPPGHLVHLMPWALIFP